MEKSIGPRRRRGASSGPNAIRLTESGLRRMIMEAMFEGFSSKRKFGGGSAQGSSLAGRKGKLQVGNVKYPTGDDGRPKSCVVFLSHVFKDGLDDMVNAINRVVPTGMVKAMKTSDEKWPTVSITFDMKMTAVEVESALKKIHDAIISLDSYDEAFVDETCYSMMESFTDISTESDLEDAKKRSISNWKDMMERLNDPAVRDSLLLFQTTDSYAEQYGNVLSQGNILQIRQQKPDASFVTQASTWRRLFNRRVNPGAQKITVTRPVPYRMNWKYANLAAKQLGYASYNDAMTKTNKSVQVAGKLKIIAKQLSGWRPTFINVNMYDVSQTTPIDPAHDVWTEEIGLSNNLYGEMNAVTKDFDQNSPKSQEQQATIARNKKRIEDAKNKQMPNRRKQVELMCSGWRGIKVDISSLKDLSDIDFIAKATSMFAEAYASKLGIAHPDQLNALKNNTTIMVCWVFGIDPGTVKSVRMYNPKNVTEEQAMQAMTVCNVIIPKIASIRPTIEKIKVESVMRKLRRLTESTEGEISMPELFKLTIDRFGFHPDDAEGVEQPQEGMSGPIESIVKEEVSRAIRNTYRRRR